MKEEIMETSSSDLKPSQCWGTWDPREKACTEVCEIKKFCQSATERRNSKTPPPAPVEPKVEKPEEVEPIGEPDPLQYLLIVMSGQHDVDTKLNDKVKCHVFSRNSEPVLQVAVLRDTGKAKLINLKTMQTVVVEKLESGEHVEKLLTELGIKKNEG